jgi:hypothetical protein
VSKYRVPAAALEAPDVPWSGRAAASFARGERRHFGRELAALIIMVVLSIGAVAMVFLGAPWAVLVAFPIVVIGGKAWSVKDRGHDPTEAVREHANEDLVAWAERVAELESPRVLGISLAGVIFGAAAERDGYPDAAIRFYDAALDDLGLLHPEPLVDEVATMAAIRGARLALEARDTARARELVERLDGLRVKKVTRSLTRLPRITGFKPFAALAGSLRELEAEVREMLTPT